MKQAPSKKRRVLIIGADGLRPDLLDPALMPAVAKLAANGVHFHDHHAVYPTHTRVNISSLTTGTTPGRHGIVANTMLVPFATEDHVIDTSDYRHLDALAAANDGQALLRPSLGDLLAQQGDRVAVAATSSPGACILWTHNYRGRLINPNSAFGLADLYDLREKLGQVPPKERKPQLDQMRYATRAVTDIFLDDPDNRVIIFWMSEPDSSLHYFGLGAEEVKQALRAVDANVAEVLRALDQRGLRDQFDLFFMSDHGHSTVVAHHTLREYLAQAQLELAQALPPLATASDYIYPLPGRPEPAADDLKPLVEWLLAQDWVGVVMGGREDLASLPGVVPLTRLWNDASNKRRPMLAVSPRWSDERNAAGVPGKVMALTTQTALRSSHGSASPFDLHAVLIANGPSFQEGLASSLPTGAVDLMPTVLTLLNIPRPPLLDGRVLWEAFCHPQGEPGRVSEEIIEPEAPATAANPAKLSLQRVGTATYLHGALQMDSVYAPSLRLTR